MIDRMLSDEFLARLRAFIRRRVDCEADSDDLVQEVLAKLVERGQAVREESLPAWLFTTARRALADRGRARRAESLADEEGLRAAEPLGPDAAAELASCLEPMLGALGEKDRELLRRVDMRGEVQAEIARELGLPLSTVKARTQRARARLLAVLTDCCEIATDAHGKPFDFRLREGRSCSSGDSPGDCARDGA